MPNINIKQEKKDPMDVGNSVPAPKQDRKILLKKKLLKNKFKGKNKGALLIHCILKFDTKCACIENYQFWLQIRPPLTK